MTLITVFTELLKNFEPIYDEFVWLNVYDKYILLINKLIEFIINSNFSLLCNRIIKFYNLKKIPSLHIVVSPIPAEKSVIMCPVQLNVASLPIPMKTDREQLISIIGIITHEFCHLLYSKLPQYNRDLEVIFKHRNVNHLFNESLATAIGNAWIYKKIANKGKLGEWYHNCEIDSYSKSIYPLIEKYLNDNRSLDCNLTTELVNFF